MQTTRRAFMTGLMAMPLLAMAPRPLDVIRATIDMDLSGTSLLYAMAVVGEGPYTLRVSPENVVYARAILSRVVVSPERYTDAFTIKAERFDHAESWALDNGTRQFYTSGA